MEFFTKYEVLGTNTYYYAFGHQPVLTVTATLYMSKSGKRKVKLDYDKDTHKGLGKIYPEISPKNHKVYHDIIVPFLNKAYPFSDDEITRKAIMMWCSDEDPSKSEMPSSINKIEDNIIFHNFRGNDEYENN